MFHSKKICILKAGRTLSGHFVSQNVIDEIAETYDPKNYNARINSDHCRASQKLGSVLALEKRGDQLLATIKPNSQLLELIERGQKVHTSCEYQENFMDSGKAYLTGLALTDRPDSLGTTEIHLSSKSKTKQITSGTLLRDNAPNNQEFAIIVSQFSDICHELKSNMEGLKEALNIEDKQEEYW